MSWKFIANIANMNIVGLLKKVLSEKETQDFITNLNTKVQLFDSGIDSTGVSLHTIGGGYSNFTLKLHPEKTKNKVTLNDTGEYHGSFRVIPLSNGDFEITSDPIKGDDNLFDRWGDNIEGLTIENHKKVLKYLESKILEELCK